MQARTLLFRGNLGIEEKVEIERTNQIKKKGNSEKTEETRKIVCRVLNCKDTVNILENAKIFEG